MQRVMSVPFNRPVVLGTEREAMERVMESGELAGNGAATRHCEKLLRGLTGAASALLTPSCTHALEMAALLLNIRPGDEVIMPSWTFVSTANAFVLRGATPIFIDIRPDTCNLDESLIEAAITPNTKAIVAVHYGGVPCEMDAIMAIAERHHLWVVEDAAQALMSSWKGKALGTIGHLGAYSFHATKNYTSGGEGGALLINAPSLRERAEIIREKGTNRGAYARNETSKYEWLDIGSSYLLGELPSACLSVQLESAHDINCRRLTLWHQYYASLEAACLGERVILPSAPVDGRHNGHNFYLRTHAPLRRDSLISRLNHSGVMAQRHYEPLHLSPAGKRFGRFVGSDKHTISVYKSILRLPMYYSLTEKEQQHVVECVLNSLLTTKEY